MNRIKWNAESIEKLKILSNLKTPVKEIAIQLGGNVSAIYTKLCELKIKSGRVKYFTESLYVLEKKNLNGILHLVFDNFFGVLCQVRNCSTSKRLC